MQNTDRGTYWAFIVWEDNIKSHPDWKQRIMATYFRFCISPYHDKDIWQEDDVIKHPDRADYVMEHLGETKKPHYHILIRCDQNTTYKTMKDVIMDLDIGVTYFKPIRAPFGYYHYLTHDNNPEKFHYDVNEIKHYNGSEPGDYLMEISKSETMEIKDKLRNMIRKNKCMSFGAMEDVAASVGNPHYQYVLQNNVTYFRQYLIDNLKKYGTYRPSDM